MLSELASEARMCYTKREDGETSVNSLHIKLPHREIVLEKVIEYLEEISEENMRNKYDS